ncbi:MAG: choice-of-anchor C family protein [Erythrobacter sp.]|nr:choice-of-anchor C family protein [Erythrobacter sp.]
MLKNLVAAATITVGLAASANAATITNGSFESYASFTTSFLALGAGSTSLDGWTIDSGSVDLIGSLWGASDGFNSLDMSGSDAGKISTTISDLIVGGRYLLSFDLAANPDGQPEEKGLRVDVADVVDTFFANRSDSTRTQMNWNTVSLTFTADSTSETLMFTSSTNSAFGPALDNVRVVAAIPLPATAPLFVLGFGALAMLRRRKKS